MPYTIGQTINSQKYFLYNIVFCKHCYRKCNNNYLIFYKSWCLFTHLILQINSSRSCTWNEVMQQSNKAFLYHRRYDCSRLHGQNGFFRKHLIIINWRKDHKGLGITKNKTQSELFNWEIFLWNFREDNLGAPKTENILLLRFFFMPFCPI